MIIPLHTVKLTEEQLDVARAIAINEVCDVAANLEIFDDSLRRTYLFKDLDLMKVFREYLASHNISSSGQGLDNARLQALFFHYHEMSSED